MSKILECVKNILVILIMVVCIGTGVWISLHPPKSTLKGYIEVSCDNKKITLNIDNIVSLREYDKECLIITADSGKYFLDESYDEVVAKINKANKRYNQNRYIIWK